MVYRISPENVRPPRGGPSGALAIVVVIGLALGIWLLAGRDPGSSTFSSVDDPGRSDARAPDDPVSGLPYMAPVDLPARVAEVLRDVDAGGELPAGVSRRPFLNGAGLLPVQRTTGYYSQYALGAGSLLVAGAGGERYYSDDDGASYSRIGP